MKLIQNTTYQEQVSSRDLCQCNFSWYSKDWRKYWVCLESGFAWFLMRSFWNCSSHWSLIDPKMDLIQYYYFCYKKNTQIKLIHCLSQKNLVKLHNIFPHITYLLLFCCFIGESTAVLLFEVDFCCTTFWRKILI